LTRLSGVIAAAATPLMPDLSIDLDRLVDHCRWLLDHGCDGINLLGTTGEATSFSLAQRLAAMQAVVESGLPRERLMVGTGAAALEDAVRLTAAARELGFAGALLLPPFYFKGIDDEGLATFLETVIQRVGPKGLRLYLYNFPQNTGVPYPLPVVQRVKQKHPEVLLGLKDSSGDMAYAARLAGEVPDFDVFPSAEGAILQADELGFRGCISATANVTGPFAAAGWRARGKAEGRAAIEKATALRQAIGSVVLVPGVKWTLARLRGDDAWRRVCPPLRDLSPAEARKLDAAVDGTAFAELAA
jgi:4-hydroxy-tetrahydrodipicolinate synthase